MSYLTFNNGFKMPIVGIGTFKIFGYENHYKALDSALEYGYRLIDTAQVYKNEGYIGDSLQVLLEKYNISRENIFITTKIAPYNHGYEKCIDSVKESLNKLKISYLDLVLIHWPGVKGIKNDEKKIIDIRYETWRGLETCVNNGLIKSIGVSNYTKKHLDELYKYATIKPSVLQSEFHPFLIQTELLNECKEKGINFQAYSSLGTSDKNSSNDLINNETITEMCKKYSKNSAQILLRWSIQQNIGVIPKSGDPIHIKENIDIFDFNINNEDMIKINSLNKNLHFCWNPETII